VFFNYKTYPFFTISFLLHTKQTLKKSSARAICRIRPGSISFGKPFSDCATRNGEVPEVAASFPIVSTQTSETAGKKFHSEAAIWKSC
jgi:hypothetical protein